MNHNRITIFSNGIADFRRSYRVQMGEPLRISLPVKQAHVADDPAIRNCLMLLADVRHGAWAVRKACGVDGPAVLNLFMPSS